MLSVLPKGHENAKTTRELAKLLQTDKRVINECIHILRLQGIPVLSSAGLPYGLFIGRNKKELERFLMQEQRRADSTSRMIEQLQENLQEEFFNE